ncbi:MAG: hypothetical protein Kow0025_21060 [Thermodesulfovibrionales bacterium]
MKNLTPYEFSKKLIAYLEKAEEATGREAVISMGTGHPAAKAELRHESPFILNILVASHVRMSPAEFERLVAHKAAYGLLFFVKGYPRWKVPAEFSDFEAFRINTLGSMLLDTVADIMAHGAGFGVNEEMLPALKRLIKAVRQGQDIFREDMSSEMRILGIVQTAIKSWGLYKYLKGLREKETARRAMSAIRKTYASEWRLIEQCQAAVLKNDIFVSEGFAAAFREVLDVFGIAGVELEAHIR